MLPMGCIKQRYDDSDILNGINFQENNKRSSQSQCFLKKNPGYETCLLTRQRYDDSDVLNGINFQKNNKRSSQSHRVFLKEKSRLWDLFTHERNRRADGFPFNTIHAFKRLRKILQMSANSNLTWVHKAPLQLYFSRRQEPDW